MPFQTNSIKVSTSDGRNFVLLEPLVFFCNDGRIYRGIVGGQTDGASVPQAIWDVYPPFGKYWIAAVIHDMAFRCTLEHQQPDGSWLRVQLDKTTCDALLLEAMDSLGVDQTTRQIIFRAVSEFGDGAFSGDLAQPIKL